VRWWLTLWCVVSHRQSLVMTRGDTVVVGGIFASLDLCLDRRVLRCADPSESVSWCDIQRPPILSTYRTMPSTVQRPSMSLSCFGWGSADQG